jgi:YesN/AraC family two-component response regulator
MLFDTKINYKSQTDTFSLEVKKSIGPYDMDQCHLHTFFEIYYLLSGERYYFIKDRTFLVKQGDLVLIAPRTLHKTTAIGLQSHERILIYFDGEFALSQSQDFSDSVTHLFMVHPLIRLTPPDQNQIEFLLQQMCREIRDQRSGYVPMLQACLLQLLVYCLRHQLSNITNSEHPSLMHQKISDIVRYINQNYPQPLTLPFIADRFAISPYYLSRSFKEATGFTFVEYVNNVRIKEAQRLLKESHQKVIYIAEQVGFGSIAHFGRVFKAVTGHSPLYYRRRKTGSGV